MLPNLEPRALREHLSWRRLAAEMSRASFDPVILFFRCDLDGDGTVEV